MRLAWFTPFSNTSAIGQYSRIVTNLLSADYRIDLWASDSGPLWATGLPVVRYRPDEAFAARLAGYDLAIYNLGDHMPFHKDVYDMSKRIPGIVILHDFVMHHFFHGYYSVHKADSQLYVEEMERWYGPEGRRMAEESMSGKRRAIWDTDDIVRFPLFEKAAEGALGVIVHSSFIAKQVRAKIAEPVEVLYLPFDQTMIPGERQHTGDSGGGKKLALLTFGNVNPNKRIDTVIEVLGDDPELARSIEYKVIGSCEHRPYVSHLQSLIVQYHLQDTVTLLDYQPDDVLHGYIEQADLFVNLRYPAMEGASWSLLEQLVSGKPVVVSDNGCYREIPDDCVVKIHPDNEKAELHQALRRLVTDRDLRQTIGSTGRQHAVLHYSGERYRTRFGDFANKINARKPLLGLTDRIGAELSLMGVSPDMGIVDMTANRIRDMFLI